MLMQDLSLLLHKTEVIAVKAFGKQCWLLTSLYALKVLAIEYFLTKMP